MVAGLDLGLSTFFDLPSNSSLLPSTTYFVQVSSCCSLQRSHPAIQVVPYNAAFGPATNCPVWRFTTYTSIQAFPLFVDFGNANSTAPIEKRQLESRVATAGPPPFVRSYQLPPLWVNDPSDSGEDWVRLTIL